MKRFTFILVCCAYLIYLPAQNSTGSAECHLKKSTGNIYNIEGTSPHSYDVLNYKLDLDLYDCYISPFPKSYTGVEEILFKADSVINFIKLDAFNSSLAIDSVGLAAVSFTHADNILTLNLDNTYSPGDTVTVKIYFRHLNVNDNAFFANNGFVFTNTAPEGARKWFICWDKPGDKATLDITAKVPSSVKFGSNGRLQDSVVTGDTIYYRWISRDPIATYLMVISSKVNYNLDIDEWVNPNNLDTIPIRYYWNQGESQAKLDNIKNIMPSLMTHFSNLFGDYPFEKNGYATLNSQFPFAGMEHQTLVSLCPNCWDEILVVHEFAHMWFGDFISPATWADVWLNEGFASYCEALWYEYTIGYERYKTAVVSHSNSYFNGNPGFPMYNPSWAVTTPPLNTLYNYAVIYAKGSAVLHMLRKVIGDSLFFHALKEYSSSPALTNYNAYTSDFISVFSQAAGQDLSWFFDQWVYGPNHPVYANIVEIDSVTNDWKMSLRIKQTQTNAGFFKMPVEILINFSDNTDTLINIFSEYNDQLFEYNFSKKPVNLQFDPENNIILKKGTTILTDVKDEINIPSDFRLNQNYPNPFNPATIISADLPFQGEVSLVIYNIMGEVVHKFINNNLASGNFEYIWKAGDLPSGVYFYRLEYSPLNRAEKFVETRKMIFLK
jgi:aminopeptidase N